MTQCDMKPRGKVGGSAISVYQAPLPPQRASIGTRLEHSIGSTITGLSSHTHWECDTLISLPSDSHTPKRSF